IAVINCTVSGNSVSGFSGGGLWFQLISPTLTNCTISGNSAVGAGGGLYVSIGSGTLTNCTISGNTAAQKGGGVYVSFGTTGQTTTLGLINAPVSGNSASTGGGLYISPGIYSLPPSSASLTNTIVAANPGGDIRGALTPGSANNLVGDGSGLTGISNGSEGNQVGTTQAPIAALLSSLGNYGGPT